MLYSCTLGAGSDKALRLLRPQAGLQQVRVADLPGTPAEGHSSLLVLDHSFRMISPVRILNMQWRVQWGALGA